jgi:hypothetical protein
MADIEEIRFVTVMPVGNAYAEARARRADAVPDGPITVGGVELPATVHAGTGLRCWPAEALEPTLRAAQKRLAREFGTPWGGEETSRRAAAATRRAWFHRRLKEAREGRKRK